MPKKAAAARAPLPRPPISGEWPAKVETRPRGRQRSLEAEAAILAATIELLKKKPLRDVTAEAIAQRAGVSKATIYKWWPNKSMVALDAFLSRMAVTVSTPDTGSALKDFTQQLQAVIRFYQSPVGGLIRHFLAEGQSDPDFLALFDERFLRARRDTVRGVIERGIKRGELRDDVDPEIMLDLLYGPMYFRLLAGHAPLDDAQAETMVAVAFRGLQKKR